MMDPGALVKITIHLTKLKKDAISAQTKRTSFELEVVSSLISEVRSDEITISFYHKVLNSYPTM